MRALLLFTLALAACEPDAPLPATPESPAKAAQMTTPEADSTWTLDATEILATGADVLVRAVRVAPHAAEGYDRIVFEFEGATPEVRVAYVDASDVTACGSGEPLAVAGDGALQIRLTGARAHDAGEPTVSHARQRRNLPALLETVPTCDFEGEVTWVLGLASPQAYRARVLDGPPRLAVDVRHGG